MPVDTKRVQAVFLAALESATPADRTAVLDRECAADLELRRRVEALLQAHDQPGSFLDQPQAPPNTADAPAPVHDATTVYHSPGEGVGTVIGPYKLLQQLGEGGMGTVFMAEQEQPVKRRVALKIIKAGMDTAHVIARFEQERQALALMDHPNIARVLDADATVSGRPFFVMELVKGVPITKFCDQEHLTPRERLELFIPVCQAVQHAHQKGIIHRDLKPSNILIALYDGRPVPKVIDFGVAKATGQKLTEGTLFTEVGQIVGTLEYMAPEQAELNNLDIDTRADIYALGAVLYQLLTGSPPFNRLQLQSAAFTEMLRMIREVEPAKPSTKLSSSDELPGLAAQRKLEPKRLTRLIQGDLDWIVMKCLEKDRGRRYETANGLAMDIQRHLADEPVLAGPPTARYRLRKFAYKNRVALTTVATIALLLVGGVVVSAWQAVRARNAEGLAQQRLEQVTAEQMKTAQALAAETKARQQTREALNSMTDDVIEQLFAKQPLLGVNEKAFLRKVLGFYKAFTADKAETDEARFVAAEGQFRVAKLQAFLGETSEAAADYREAIRLLEKLAVEAPTVPGYRQQLAGSYNNLGLVLSELGKWSEAETAYRQALAIQEKLATDFPTVPAYRRELANGHNSLGALLIELGKRPEAEAAYRLALVIQEKLAADFPHASAYREELAVSHSNLGNLLRELGELVAAESAYRLAVGIQEKLTGDFSSVAAYRLELARSRSNFGNLLGELGKPMEAETVLRQALAIQEKLVTDFPTVPAYRQELARGRNNLGILLSTRGKRPEAETYLRQALAIQEKLAADFPAVPAYRTELAASCINFGSLLRDKGLAQDSLEWYSKPLPFLEANLVQDSRLTMDRLLLRSAHINRARALMDLKRYGEALKDWDRAIDLSERPDRAVLRLGRATTLARAGDHGRAVSEADEVTANADTPGGRLFDAAGVYGASVAVVQADAHLKDLYAGKALSLLRRAQGAGYFRAANMVAKLQKDDDLAPLRHRADFNAFVAEIVKKLPPRGASSPTKPTQP